MKRMLFVLAILALLVACSNPVNNNGDNDNDTTVVAVTAVTLDRSAAAVMVGSTTQLTATVTPSDATDPTVMGSPESNGHADGAVSSARAMGLFGITNTAEAVYFTDMHNSAIREIQ